MSDHEGDIFDITYSLPVLASSVAISTRTPTAGFTQESKYMPDYGGVLEIPGSNIKNNSLTSRLPFTTKTKLREVSKIERYKLELTVNQLPNDCVTVSTYSQAHDGDQFSVIHSVDNKLCFDLVNKHENQESNEQLYSSREYLREEYSDSITGIKNQETIPETLFIKFKGKFTVVKLNKLFKDLSDPDTDVSRSTSISNQKPLESSFSITERQDFFVKDVCLNPYNNTILSLASDNLEAKQLKLYDLSSSSFKKPFYTSTWDNNEVEPTSVELNRGELTLRKRVIRTFSSRKPAIRGIQQLDHIPHHLVNMILTTGSRIVLVDPRVDRIPHTYADRFEIPSFYPIEFFKGTEFSSKNSYQFYSTSNVHIRVFDTRYSKVPLNQVNHMLDSNCKVNLKLVDFKMNHMDTLCVSTPDRLCFVTFDQAQRSNLVNPNSCHPPYHERNFCEDIPVEAPHLLGLGLKINESSRLDDSFSILQSTREGKIYIRSYMTRSDPEAIEARVQMPPIIRDIRISQTALNGSRSNLDYRDTLDSPVSDDEREYLDILDPEALEYAEEMFESKRAYERFEKMKTALGS